MIKLCVLAISAIAFGLLLVSVLVTGIGAFSVVGSTTTFLLVVGSLAAIVGVLMRDECGPGRPCF